MEPVMWGRGAAVAVIMIVLISVSTVTTTLAAIGTSAPRGSTLDLRFGPDVVRPVTTITVTLSINPQQVTKGSSISVQSSTSGGAPPYSFVYAGLPSGCNGQNQPSFSCNPSSTGTYSVQVTATDSHGNQSAPSNSVNLDVTSASNGNGNGNGGGNNSSNPLSSLSSGLGGYLAIAFIFAIVGFATWILLIVGVWVIAVVLMRRLPKPGEAAASGPGSKCGSCSAAVPGGAKFCPQCGTSTTPKGT
ncbi:MAG: zinc ribbon domain-containing protein [Thermoplasmata archaeon]|nr:zinc ribbon domain-containing protein [Thermoplasmata archaeon]